MSLTSPSPNPLPARRKARLRPPAPPALSWTPAASRTAAPSAPDTRVSLLYKKEPICPAPLSSLMPTAAKQQKTSNFIEFYEISTERIPLERAKRLRRTCLGFVARHDFRVGPGNHRVDDGFRGVEKNCRSPDGISPEGTGQSVARHGSAGYDSTQIESRRDGTMGFLTRTL